MEFPRSDEKVDKVPWDDDSRNLGRLSPREVMLQVYGTDNIRAIEQANAAAEQASHFITDFVVGRQ